MSSSLAIHPKPLAFTATAGGILLPRAIYRSGELLKYSADLNPDNPQEMYLRYLQDPNIVVIDDSTYQTEGIDTRPVNAVTYPNGLDVEAELIRMLDAELFKVGAIAAKETFRNLFTSDDEDDHD